MISTQDHIIYGVERTKPSASAFAIFAHHPHTGGDVVLKVLKEMQDKRYDLSTIGKRKQCQLEALGWNPKFTPGVYFGVAHIRETLEKLQELERERRPLREIGVEPVLEHPEQPEHLQKRYEYALLMRRLPECCRLDKLLEKNKKDITVPTYLTVLLNRIHAIHSDHSNFPVFLLTTEVDPWGSMEQLYEKLRGNLTWFKDSLENLSRSSETYKKLVGPYNQLVEKLPLALEMQKYQELFKRRLDEGHIKRCHGDLKADNIWIETGPLYYLRPETGVRLLDCIDFNPSFYMIDTLSDIALLVADIQARTGNPDLAEAVLTGYLQISGEDEDTARNLLAYYLVEKAMIGMINSYIDDKKEELGDGYREVVRQRLGELMNRL